MDRKTRIVLVDDHEVVRSGFRRLLEQVPNFEVVAEAGNGQDAYRILAGEDDVVAVMDISMPGITGLEVIRRLRSRSVKTRILVLSVHDSPGVVKRALDAGADGYLCKSGAADEMIAAIRAVAAGRRYLSADVAQRLASGASSAVPSAAAKLTAREYEVLRLFSGGASIQDVAAALHVSPKTVANHLSGIKLKLGARNHADLMRLALEDGIGGDGTL